MTLKARLSLMLSLFFVLIAILSVGSISIFQRISEHMGALRSVSEETKRYNELDRNIGDLVDATRGWGLTGDAKYKKQYFMKTSDVRESLEKVIKGAKKTETETIDLLDKETQQILQYAEVVIRIRQPRGNNEVIDYLRNIDTIALDIIKKIDGMQEYSTDRILDVLIVSEALKGKMLSYYGVLILFCSFQRTPEGDCADKQGRHVI
jgi:CHASE3 domain sensor protein